MSERYQFGLVWFRGGLDIIAIPENDVGVAALVLVIPPDVGPFVGVMERYHVITNQDFKLANWNGLPALGIAEKITPVYTEFLEQVHGTLDTPIEDTRAFKELSRI